MDISDTYGPQSNENTELKSQLRPQESVPVKWLTLKDACDFLGVHYTTLRTWADKGEIAVFRTPGGHRRFSLADLRRFLDERAGYNIQSSAIALVDHAIGRTRQAIQENRPEMAGWQYQLASEDHEMRKTRGRKLFGLAIAYVLKPNQRERTIQDAAELGREYGVEAAKSGVNLAETGRAVQFFRNQLVQTLVTQDSTNHHDADDLRIRYLVDQVLDEVLYAVLDGFESIQTK